MDDILWDEDAVQDMRSLKLRAHEVARITDEVGEQLSHQPRRLSKRK